MSRPLRIALVLAMALALAACSKASDPAESDLRPASSTGPTDADPAADAPSPGAPDPAAVNVDLSGQTEDSEIATLLEFTTGAGGLDWCANYGFDDEFLDEVAPDVSVETGGHAPVQGYPIGSSRAICIGRSPGPVTGTITPPDGKTVEIAGPGAQSRVGAVAIAQAEPFDDVAMVVVATLPGAPVGDYEVHISNGASEATFALSFRPASDLGTEPRHFQYTRYDDVYPAGTHDVVLGEDVEFGFVGKESGATGAYFLFRSSRQYSDGLPAGNYTLVDRLEVTYDDRGEAALHLPTASSLARACYVLLEREEALERVGALGWMPISSAEPAAFCVGSDPNAAVRVDDCDQLDAILDSWDLPARGHTFCADDGGAILSFHASNYGFTAYTPEGDTWVEGGGINLGDESVPEVLTGSGVPADTAEAICTEVAAEVDGIDLGC